MSFDKRAMSLHERGFGDGYHGRKPLTTYPATWSAADIEAYRGGVVDGIASRCGGFGSNPWRFKGAAALAAPFVTP